MYRATDHLSDRELYTDLWTDSLGKENPTMLPNANGAWHILTFGGDEDHQLYLKYYA
jgi:hypothetical protein